MLQKRKDVNKRLAEFEAMIDTWQDDHKVKKVLKPFDSRESLKWCIELKELYVNVTR